MQELMILTNTGNKKQFNMLTEAAKNIVNLSKVWKICVSKKKETNIAAMKEKKVPKVLVIDSNIVPKQTAETYVDSIKKQFSGVQFVVVGTNYCITGATSTDCWKTIKALAA